MYLAMFCGLRCVIRQFVSRSNREGEGGREAVPVSTWRQRIQAVHSVADTSAVNKTHVVVVSAAMQQKQPKTLLHGVSWEPELRLLRLITTALTYRTVFYSELCEFETNIRETRLVFTHTHTHTHTHYSKENFDMEIANTNDKPETSRGASLYFPHHENCSQNLQRH